jgi:hypothetical protein
MFAGQINQLREQEKKSMNKNRDLTSMVYFSFFFFFFRFVFQGEEDTPALQYREGPGRRVQGRKWPV